MPIKNISGIKDPALGKDWAKCSLSQDAVPSHSSLSDILKDQHTSVYKSSLRKLCVTYIGKASLKC